LKANSDSEIIDKILNGNPDLFRVLVERYKSPVAAIIKGMLGDCPEADDVGQETFIRLYNSLANFRGDAALKTYLIRIAMNLSLNEIKKKKRFNSSTVFIDSGINIDHDDGMLVSERTETMEMIQKAMDSLDLRQRSVFILRIVEGYSTKETAKILKIPLGTVLSRLARAIEEMRGLVTRV
jgi:RNA polymerase sigma-70 factor (ECF subfamily)